jgi:hypothetical protein
MATPTTIARKSLRYLQKNYRYLAEDPSFFWMKTAARFELARQIAKRTSSVPPPAPAPQTSVPAHVFADRGTAGVVSCLEHDGYYVGLRLAPHALATLHEKLAHVPCFADRERGLPFRVTEREEAERRMRRKFKTGSYFRQHEEWPVFQAIVHDPTLREIAQTYLSCVPTFLRSEICWSFPRQTNLAERLANAQVFHCDINDFRTLKFFFYLTDVGPGAGPHRYIKKGPRSRILAHQLLGQRCASIPDEVLEQTYGEQTAVIYGDAGLGFVGDPYYFHRGDAPTERSRLLMQLEFGCKRYRSWYSDVT